MNINIKHVGFLAIVILIVSFALVGVSVNFVAGDQASNRVLNLAGRQRMLSQRIFKDIYKLDVYPGNRMEIISDVRKSYDSFIAVHKGLLDGDLDLGLPVAKSAEVIEQHEKISEMLIPVRDKIGALLATNRIENMEELRDSAQQAENTLLFELNHLVEIFESEANKASAKLNQVYIAAGIFYFAVLALCFISGYVLTKRIKNGVLKMRKQSASLEKASESLSISSEDLSASSVEQESAVTQTLAALVQINAVVTKNCESVQDCFDNIGNVKKMSSEGSQAIADLAGSLNIVNASVDELEEFNSILRDIEVKTQVIDDIVLKTQLLSVNASIEAERAGELGVGFSVVAEEVGKLAITSGNEAKEIKNLINGSFSRVKVLVDNSRKTTAEGLKSCELSKELYHSINSEFHSVNEQMRDIADASIQQEAGIKQVNSSMNSIKEAIHINSKSAASYKEMASGFTGDAKDLGTLAGYFSGLMGVSIKRTHDQQATSKDFDMTRLESGSVESLIAKANQLKYATNDSHLTTADDESFKRRNAS